MSLNYTSAFLAAQQSVKDRFRIGNIHEYMKERALRGHGGVSGQTGEPNPNPNPTDTGVHVTPQPELANSESLDHLVALVRRRQRQIRAATGGPVLEDELESALPTSLDQHVTEWYAGREGVWLVVDKVDGGVLVKEGGPTSLSVSVSASTSWKYCYILETHCRLLPAGVSSNSKDYPVHQCCTILEQNWTRLRPFLLPTLEYCPGGGGSGLEGETAGDPPIPTDAELVDSEGTPKPFQHVPMDYTLTFPEWINLRSDQSLMDRVHYSYNVLLHYLGWRMHNQETGELDRHAYWRERYHVLEADLLAQYSGSGRASTDSASPSQSHVATTTAGSIRGGIGGYTLIIPILRTLIEFRLTVFAKNLLRFVLEEMLKGRLLFLREVWTAVWVPYLQEVVEERPDLQERIQHDCQRMLRRAAKIGHDDSDSD